MSVDCCNDRLPSLNSAKSVRFPCDCSLRSVQVQDNRTLPLRFTGLLHLRRLEPVRERIGKKPRYYTVAVVPTRSTKLITLLKR